jgi:tRNA(fMet)-specific endonuclease VapC
MTDYLVDTNHLSVLVTKDHPLRLLFVQRMKLDDTFAIAVPALAEMLFGIHMTPRSKQNLAEWTQLSVTFLYLDTIRQDAERAATLQAELRRHGWQLGTVDALIAATALRYDLTLLTSDKDFSRIPGLRLENWVTTTGN